jgi:transcriptional regulator GlxA family with amidase domain
MNVQIVLFNGFDELDAIAPHEVWHMAKDIKPEIEVQLVTLDGTKEIVASNKLRVQAEGQLGEKHPDLVVVPGGGWMGRSPAGAWAEAKRGPLPAKLAELHRQEIVMTSVCTGAMLLAAAGLLKNRPATTNHGALDELEKAGARVVPARVVDDGDVVTSGGITAGIDLSLWLVERFFGSDTAFILEGLLEYERRGTVWKTETRRRVAEIEKGEVQGIPGDEVSARVRRIIGR